MSGARPEDDHFHPIADTHPHWSETCWFSFGQSGIDLSGTFYPLFRPNLGVASLGVSVWDAASCEPWNVLYHRERWHLPHPTGDLTNLELAGLRYETLEPLRRYRVRYRDGDLLDVDLEYEGIIPPHDPGGGKDGHGHLDQPCRVVGEVTVRGVRHDIDCFDMRDRSWQVRGDDRSTRAGYSYAIASPQDAFLAFAFRLGEEDRILAGFLLRDGEKANLVEGTRRVQRSSRGWPERVEISARDALGRVLECRGITRNRLANQASSGLFAWMSLTRWDLAGESYGQDQDIWSPDQLGGAMVP